MAKDSKAVELFNAHQIETKKQLEFLAKSIFLIAGSALTLSISLFLSDNAPKLSCELAQILKNSWTVLFLCIVCIILALVIMLIRDYLFGEKWRVALDDHENNRDADVDDIETMHVTYDKFIILFSVLSLVLFLLGLAELGWVASTLLDAKKLV